MLCGECGGKSKVVDSRRPGSKNDPSMLLLACPPSVCHETQQWRARKRECVECGCSFYTIEVELAYLEGMLEGTKTVPGG